MAWNLVTIGKRLIIQIVFFTAALILLVVILYQQVWMHYTYRPIHKLYIYTIYYISARVQSSLCLDCIINNFIRRANGNDNKMAHQYLPIAYICYILYIILYPSFRRTVCDRGLRTK
jgi:hypothetical protein